MKEVIKYKTEDGREFASKEEAYTHENRNEIQGIIAQTMKSSVRYGHLFRYNPDRGTGGYSVDPRNFTYELIVYDSDLLTEIIKNYKEYESNNQKSDTREAKGAV